MKLAHIYSTHIQLYLLHSTQQIHQLQSTNKTHLLYSTIWILIFYAASHCKSQFDSSVVFGNIKHKNS